MHNKVHTTLKTGKPAGRLRIIEPLRTLQKNGTRIKFRQQRPEPHKPQREMKMNIAQFLPLSDCGKGTEKNSSRNNLRMVDYFLDKACSCNLEW